jgi:hypothetical protein
MSKHYEIEYRYYQYNSGAADNGEYTRALKKTDRQEAIDLARRICESVGHHQRKEFDKCDEALSQELIPYMGYFLGATVYECQRDAIALTQAEQQEQRND